MKLVRSWPDPTAFDTIADEVTAGRRGYVVDGIPRLVMSSFDYRCLADLDDDVLLIEWDIAIGGEQLSRLIARCRAEPDRVRVAPYLLYKDGDAHRPFYVHRIREPGHRRWVTGPEDAYCHLMGFGLTYLPKALIAGFVETLKPNEHFGDTTFSYWHMRHAPHRDVPIDWDCHAIHLHYRVPEVTHGDR